MSTRNFYSILFFFFCVVPFSNAENNERPVNWQELPEPYHTSSAINPPKIISRPKQAELSVPAGFVVEEYLSDFSRPRFMLLGDGGEILLSDMSDGVIYVIHDKKITPLIEDLDSPYGLALYKDWLYVATSSFVWRYKYSSPQRSIGKAEQIIDLRPYASGHTTRSILFDEEQGKLYLSVGSRSNVDDGEPPIRAAISRYNPDGTGFELFATGIRNAVGIHWSPVLHEEKKELWVTSHERDGLGDDLVPDYFSRVIEGGFYGWPYAYIGPHEDPRHRDVAPDKVQKTLYPDVLLGSHVGAMDFEFYTASQFPEKYHGGAFIALHGSWNRSKRVGYKIIFVPFKDGRALSGGEDFLTGWRVSEDSIGVWGRPVGILQMPDGSLLISDDGAGKLWRVSYMDR